MQKFTSITSSVIPIDLKDIDTDMIIPAQYMTSTSKGGYGQNLFRRLRDADPNFPLNLDKYKEAQIIVARDNFGCGSSREHAVWALLEYGIRAIIAPSFADIFYNNSLKNGLLPIGLPEETITELFHLSTIGPCPLTIDLPSQTVIFPDKTTHHFFFDPYRKDCILKGHDDLDYLLEHLQDIDTWHQSQKHK